MNQINSRIPDRFTPKAICAAVILASGLAAPSYAQERAGAVATLEEVLVSARRQQESVQEVPISITVFNQEDIARNNIVSGSDLAQYTPSLAVNQRFGPDQASFAIRGFTQELRTTASVGFYFAEVVAPRGGGSTTAGDGAGPGAFFDLQDVLVLKGPQGTLFGRNTTGGAILLTPQEPTNALEGYIEGSAGNYDMQRVQGVINIPFGDRVRTRFGIDTMQRDGHLKNRSDVGPDELGNTDYFAARASIVVELSDDIENYTILSYSDSDNDGVVSTLFACKPGLSVFNMGCPQQLAHQGNDFYSVETAQNDPVNELTQWQVINTTTWSVNDDLTVRNILSYADLEQTNETGYYGLNYDYYGLGTYSFTESQTIPGTPTNSQVSFVEELQLQGYALDGALTWQAGLYFEKSRADGTSGSQSSNNLFCSSVDSANPGNSTCVDVARNYFYQALGFDVLGMQFGSTGYGGISRLLGEIDYTNQAVYTEVTYEISDEWRLTGGLRYTKDEVEGSSQAQIWNSYPYLSPAGTPVTPGVGTTACYYSHAELANSCKESLDQDSDAVTGLFGVDYFVSQDVMLYAKYSRGYRMGSLNLFGGEGYRTFGPEQVDAYEAGAKAKFGGAVPGTFNIAVFYNDLKDQQLQYGFVQPGVPPTTVIANTGKSVIQGVEVETSLRLLEDVSLNISYTYLDTELEEADEFTSSDPRVQIVPTSRAGTDLTFSPRHSLTAGLSYRLPLPSEIGDVTIGAVYTYTDEQNSSAPEYTDDNGRLASSPYARLPSYETVNLSASWMSIMGSNFDGSLFVTNTLDEEYTTYVPGNYHSLGFETRMVGMPRMFGARLRYSFGQ